MIKCNCTKEQKKTIHCVSGSYHCIHSAINCFNNRTVSEPGEGPINDPGAGELAKRIKEYLKDHPEEGLET